VGRPSIRLEFLMSVAWVLSAVQPLQASQGKALWQILGGDIADPWVASAALLLTSDQEARGPWFFKLPGVHPCKAAGSLVASSSSQRWMLSSCITAVALSAIGALRHMWRLKPHLVSQKGLRRSYVGLKPFNLRAPSHRIPSSRPTFQETRLFVRDMEPRALAEMAWQ